MKSFLPLLNLRMVEDNKHTMKLSTGSSIKSRPSGKQSGRSLAGSLLIIDEAAFIENIDTIWAAVYPIISTGGRAFVLSTVNGIGNWYYDVYHKAVAGENSFHAIDINWESHPEYKRMEGFDDLYKAMEAKDLYVDKWEGHHEGLICP
jgi:phage FluMu gp28-like protein